MPVSSCGEYGKLDGELYGAFRATLAWDRADLECEGMPRPEGDGVRLRFAGALQEDAHRVAIILAMPDFERTTTRAELSANVTLIEEGNGRFYSTPDLDNCLADILSVEALNESGDFYSVAGVLYCVSPLPEINGDSSVSIPELHFSGLLDWGAS